MISLDDSEHSRDGDEEEDRGENSSLAVLEEDDDNLIIPTAFVISSTNNNYLPPSSDHTYLLSSHVRTTKELCWSQLTLSELSGSLGDLGTFIPLYVALCHDSLCAAAPALFCTGLCHVLTGLLWNLPMPVQPMKSIAAVALMGGDYLTTRQQVTTAGIWMGIFLTVMGVTNAIEWVNRIVPMAVVCGLQLGVGISLATKGFHLVADLPWWWWSSSSSSSDGGGGGLDCVVLGLICALVCLYSLREPFHAEQERQQHHSPTAALYLFLLGSVIAVAELVSSKEALSWTFRPSILTWALSDTSWKDWKVGLLEGAIPQLPLSTLNSVISICCLAQTLYPNRQNDPKLSRRQVCLSVGLMNLLLCPLGAIPNCHGAGGLAGQYKFGARHGASVIFLGVVKMLLAISLGTAVILPFLEKFPSSILGVLLATAGLELACTGLVVLVQTYRHGAAGDDCQNHSQSTRVGRRNSDFRTNTGVALLTAAVILGLKKTHYGAAAGWVAHMIYGDGVQEWRRGWWGSTEREYEQVLQQSQEETRETEEPPERTLPVS